MPAPTGPLSCPGPFWFGRLRGMFALGLVAAVVALAPWAPAAASHLANGYHQTNLVSDLPGLAQLTDPDPPTPTPLRAAARNYSRALDQLSQEAGLAA